MSGDRTVPQRILKLDSEPIQRCLIDLFRFEFDNSERRVAYNDYYDAAITKHSQTWTPPERGVEE